MDELFNPNFLYASFAGGLIATVLLANAVYIATGWPQRYSGIVVAALWQILAWVVAGADPTYAGPALVNAAAIYFAAAGIQWQISSLPQTRAADAKRRFRDPWAK